MPNSRLVEHPRTRRMVLAKPSVALDSTASDDTLQEKDFGSLRAEGNRQKETVGSKNFAVRGREFPHPGEKRKRFWGLSL